jgi:endonuclease/exonuclease/phosphatase family metal-dependent hydrolase
MQESPSPSTFTCEQSTDSKVGTYSLKIINHENTGSLRRFRLNNFTQTAGKKVYVGMWVKTSKRFSEIRYSTHESGTIYPEATVPPNNLDTWEWCSYVGIMPANASFFYYRFTIPGRQNGDYFMIDGLTVIDLTTAYGAGNEPRLNEIDLLIRSLPYISTTTIVENYNATIATLKANDQTARQVRLSNNIIRVGTLNAKYDYLYPNMHHKLVSNMDLDLISLNECALTNNESISLNYRTINYNLLYSYQWGRTTTSYGMTGLGMASAFPMLNTINLPTPEQGYIKTTVVIGGHNVSVYSIHLPGYGTNIEGKAYITGLYNNVIALDASEYIIVAGDFNYPHVDQDATVWETFTNNGFTAAQGGVHGWMVTYPDTPGYIDNIMVKGFNILETGVQYSSLISDHNAFWAEIQMITDSKIDQTPPVLKNVPADKNLGNNPKLPSCDANVTATGGCSEATVTCTAGTIKKDGCNRSQTFTYTATDACGNKAAATTTYTWTEDLTPPVLTNVPANKNLGNNPELPTCDTKVTASDQCGEATVVCTPGTIIKDGCNRSQTFTYTATDASGNKATAKTTYTWTEDLTAPVLANVPIDKYLGNNPELPSCDAKVTAADQCSNATVTCTPGAIIKDGCKRSQTFTYTATDASGNKATATTTFTWTEDLTPPVLANVPADKNLGNNPELPSCDAKVTAAGSCSEATLVCTPGNITKDGCNRSQTFTYTATDASGNKATATTTYTWTEDLTPPVLSNVPADKNLGNNPELPSCDAKVTASGSCSEATVVCTPGNIIKDGCNRSQIFTYTATDASGNKATATTTYTWTEDLTPPVLSNVPADKNLGHNPELPTCDQAVTAADQCGVATINCTPGPITVSGNNRIQIFKYTATDVSGNTATATTTYTWTEGIIAPVADFAATENILKEGETVQIEDLSDNNPVSWSWKFEGGTPGTSSHRNPVVKYYIPGKYSVTLTVANASGSDTKSVDNFITVEENSNPDEIVTGDEQVSGQTSLYKVYPNPVIKYLVLKMNTATAGFTYTLYDVNGRKLQTDKIISELTIVDLSEQFPGLYLLVIEKGNQIFRELIVKQ